jgi:CheY-like chemotaxis protein
VVDDNTVNRSILHGFCTEWGMECRSADSGITARTSLRDAAAQGWQPDVILLDIHLPGEDGWQTAARIRSIPALSACPVIVMLNGASQQDAGLRRSLGINGYLLKPVLQDEIYETIRLVLKPPAAQSPPEISADTVPAAALQRLSILVAEDVSINQKLIQRVLEKLGHTVTIANNGEEALQLWRHASYDLIFMDIEMPVMDGLSAVAAIRAIEYEQGGHVPIIAMTAHVLQGDAENFQAAGMDAYISKPFKSSDVRTCISRMTDQAETPLSGK